MAKAIDAQVVYETNTDNSLRPIELSSHKRRFIMTKEEQSFDMFCKMELRVLCPEKIRKLKSLKRLVEQSTITKGHACIPGVVDSYCPKTQTANIWPSLNEDEAYDFWRSVPVLFPSSTKFSITWPLQKNDSVWLLSSTSLLQQWGEKGGYELGKTRKFIHSIGNKNFVAIPAGRPPYANPLQYASEDSLRIGEDCQKTETLNFGGACIKIKEGKISIGDTNSDLLGLVCQLTQQVIILAANDIKDGDRRIMELRCMRILTSLESITLHKEETP